MKSVKTFVSIAVLLFVFAVNTRAGEQQTPGYVPPPPTSDRTMSTSTETDTTQLSDNTYSEQSGETTETSDYLLLEAFAALLSVY